MSRPPFLPHPRRFPAYRRGPDPSNVPQIGDDSWLAGDKCHNRLTDQSISRGPVCSTLADGSRHRTYAKEAPEMPEAVIVDTVRTPIGRAFKGSLASLRPEEQGAFVVDQLLERNPALDPALVEDVFCGVGMPQGLQAFNMGPIMSRLSKLPRS